MRTRAAPSHELAELLEVFGRVCGCGEQLRGGRRHSVHFWLQSLRHLARLSQAKPIRRRDGARPSIFALDLRTTRNTRWLNGFRAHRAGSFIGDGLRLGDRRAAHPLKSPCRGARTAARPSDTFSSNLRRFPKTEGVAPTAATIRI